MVWNKNDLSNARQNYQMKFFYFGDFVVHLSKQDLEHFLSSECQGTRSYKTYVNRYKTKTVSTKVIGTQEING